VSRSYLDCAGAEVHVDQLVVSDEHKLAVDERVLQAAAVHVLVPGILRMDRDSDVAQHGLGTCGSHHNLLVRTDKLVRKGPDDAEHICLVLGVTRHGDASACLDVHIVDLDIRDARAKRAAPVGQSNVAIDQAILVELDEGRSDCGNALFVESEDLAGPVEGATQAPQLVGNVAMALLLVLPHALEEGLSAHVVPRQLLLFGELLLDDDLRRNASVVGAGDPERVVSAHAMPARQQILNSDRQCVPNVQRASHVRRRQAD